MKITVALPLLGATLTSAQVVFTNGSFVCAESGGIYCAGDSLATNIIIRCSGTVGQPGNCNDNLAGIPPVGVKSFAPCYQASPTAGDASCSFDGIVYPEDGSAPFKIASGGSPPSSAVGGSAYGGSMTTIVSHYTTGTVTNTYTITVPCSTTAASPVSPPAVFTPLPSPTTVFTAVTISSCYSSCQSSSSAPPLVVPPPSSPARTYPTSALPATTYAPALTPSSGTFPGTFTPPPGTTYAPVPQSSSQAPVVSSYPPAPPASTPSTMTSVVVVGPTPVRSTPISPVGGSRTSSAPAQYTGAAAKHGNSFAGAAVFAMAAVAMV